ncbi:MAG: aldehyde dehydrogenase [Oscillospiraceae bacterium]
MNAEQLVDKQRKFFETNATKDISFRKKALLKLKALIEENEGEISLALKEDLGKSRAESYLTEIGIVMSELDFMVKNIDRLSGKNRKHTPLTHFPARSYTIREPYGVVLILSPWNYPFQLSIAPLIGAIAGGNCAVVKCSKSSVASSKLICKLINSAFGDEYVHCFDVNLEYDDILNQRYDYIFFTGSARIGKIVMGAAAKNLTPISLELGGKSPCFVDKNANIALAAKRIIWGKGLNSGQTCVAPDYILVDQEVEEKLIFHLKKQIKIQLKNCVDNPDYPKIISEQHFKRLKGLIERQTEKVGGEINEEKQKIAICLFKSADFDCEVMEEEIFGPILPIIAYKDLSMAISQVKGRDKPLACYIFTKDRAYSNKIIKEVSFGGGCVNDVVMHIANHSLPFGGVGASGMGSYHGAYSFETFTHEKAILENKNILDIPLRYPPYKKASLKLIKKIMGQ